MAKLLKFIAAPVLAGVAMLVCGAVAVAAPQKYEIRFSHVVADDTPKGRGAARFKELLEKRFSDRVSVSIYSNAKRMNDNQAILAVSFGEIEMAAPSITKLQLLTPRLQIYDLPYLFDSQAALEAFEQSGEGQELLGTMKSQGVLGLDYWAGGPRVISGIRPILWPWDVTGLTFRIETSALFAEQWRALGAAVINLPFDGVSRALAQGLVNAQENTWSNIASKELYSRQPFFTELNHSFLSYMVIINQKFWTALPQDIQLGIKDVLHQVRGEVAALSAKSQVTDRARVAAQPGIKILTPSAEQREQWRKQMRQIWPIFEEEIGYFTLDEAERINREVSGKAPRR